MKNKSGNLIHSFGLLTGLVYLIAGTCGAQTAVSATAEPHLRSELYTYDLRDGSSHLIFSADAVWEAPNWSPDGSYLIANSGGTIYKLSFKADGSRVQPERLHVPAEYGCNNDKAISPDGKKIAFSASVAPGKGSQVFVADVSGDHVERVVSLSPSYFHGWSPDNRTLAFVAQRGGSGQYDIYTTGVQGGEERRMTFNPHQEDGPDYSPDGRWIYVNSDRTGKEAVWRLPAEGAGPNDAKAEMVVNDSLEDWFPHISPDGKKMVYIGYPAGTPTHNPRDVAIELKLVNIEAGAVAQTQRTLVKAVGGQGSMNVNSWSPDSMRFAYVTYKPMP